MKKENGIYRSVSFIEESLADALSIDGLADRSYFSRTHYQRLFRSVVGEPVMEYIKKRRLQQASRMLGEGAASVLEVAIAYGYDSYEGFSRAFKAYFGMPPSRYGKITVGMEREEAVMLSMKLQGSFAKRTGEIARVLEPIGTEFARLAKTAGAEGEKAGTGGISIRILADEYGELANRMRGIVKEIKDDWVKPDQQISELSDRTYMFLKKLDDISFQMNILYLFSTVETARIAVPPPEAFAGINAKLAELVGRGMETRKAVMKILDGLMRLVGEEIKKDAEGKLSSAVEWLQKAASDGVVLTADIKAAALSLGEHGSAYMCVANDLEKQVKAIKAAVEAMKAYKQNRKPVDDALWDMATAAGMTNVNAFNAKIETARSGGMAVLETCTARLLKYPAQIQEAYFACVELFDESVELMGLLEHGRERGEPPLEAKFQKSIKDILYQNELLLAQAKIEAERCKHEPFRRVNKKIEGALAALSGALNGDGANDKDAVTAYHRALSEIVGEYQGAVADAGVTGVVHRIIAEEFRHFLTRISAVLSYLQSP
jgi:AraC-like DNA-binding protein